MEIFYFYTPLCVGSFYCLIALCAGLSSTFYLFHSFVSFDFFYLFTFLIAVCMFFFYFYYFGLNKAKQKSVDDDEK